jgi:hypothetical protein
MNLKVSRALWHYVPEDRTLHPSIETYSHVLVTRYWVCIGNCIHLTLIVCSYKYL